MSGLTLFGSPQPVHVALLHIVTMTLIVVGIVVSLLGPATATAQAASCPDAQQLADAKLLDEAMSAFTRILKDHPNDLCADEGIKSVASAQSKARELFARGEAYESAGKKESARKDYIEALIIDPQLEEAETALTRLLQAEGGDDLSSANALTEAGFLSESKESLKETVKASGAVSADVKEAVEKAHFAAAQALADAGLHDEARTELESVVKSTGLAVPEELSYLQEDKGGLRGTLRRELRTYSNAGLGFVREIGAIGGAMALVLVAIILFVLWGRRFKRSLSNLSLQIEDFDDGPSEGTIGKGVAQMVEEWFHHSYLRQDPQRTDILTGTSDLSLPADVGAAATQLKLLTSLLQWLFPPKVFVLSGYLHYSNAKGAGMTVSLADNRKKAVLDNVTLWESEFGRVSPQEPKVWQPFYNLAEPAAIWAAFKIREHAKAA
jgi:tetratricopeptide (TPR) repeat protein